jgi:hypothetical protein
MHLSHFAGPRDAPLIDATIGEQLEIAERFADCTPSSCASSPTARPTARCTHCARPLADATAPVHPECLAGGLAAEVAVGLLSLLVLALAPTVIVWAG